MTQETSINLHEYPIRILVTSGREGQSLATCHAGRESLPGSDALWGRRGVETGPGDERCLSCWMP